MLNRRLRRPAGAVLTAALALGLAASPAWAQEPTGDDGGGDDDRATTTTTVPDDTGIVHSWALVPGDGTLEAGQRPHFTYDLPPGGETEDVVTLFNYSNVQLTFDVYATDAFNNDDGSFDLLAGDQEPTDVGAWFDLGLDGVTVPPGSQATFPVTVRVPVDARPGDHAGAVLAASEAQGTGPDGRVINLDRRTGARVYLRVAGALEPELAVEDLSTSYAPALNPADGRAEVSYRIVNRGNVRLAARHRVSVGGPFGLLRRTTDTEEVAELLPGESIEYTRTIDDVAATGLAFTEVDLEPMPVGGGDDEELEPVDRSSFVFAVPFTVLAVLIAAGLAAYARRSYLRHRRELVVEPAR